METLFRKVLVSERVPDNDQALITITNNKKKFSVFKNNQFVSVEDWKIVEDPEYWLEEFELPSEDDVIMFLNKKYHGHASTVTIKDTYNYILGFINKK